jgi:serine/threonine-protein kinase RsbT
VAVLRSELHEIRSSRDVMLSRQVVRRLALDLEFSLVDQTKIITAASELARNTLIYGMGGTMCCEILTEGVRRGLRVIFEDEGPGIEDIPRAMEDGFTSGNGLGKGLPGSKRLVNDFEIQSAPGEGTRVSITRWR